MTKNFDIGTFILSIITVFLFTIARIVLGFANELLYEAGVLLVAINLINMACRISINHKDVRRELSEIKKLLRKKYFPELNKY